MKRKYWGLISLSEIWRWLLLFAAGVFMCTLALGVLTKLFFAELIHDLTLWMLDIGSVFIIELLAVIFLFCGGYLAFRTGRKIFRILLHSYGIVFDENMLEHKMLKNYLSQGPRITVIGGGTGLSMLLSHLKHYTSNLIAVVTVADDGGSSGILREEIGILPPGDIRNCLVALSEQESLMEKLFCYRFSKGGDLSSHNFGNLFIAAMADVCGDFMQAVRESGKILAIQGKVLPCSLDNIRLSAEFEDGKKITGETAISSYGKEIRFMEIEPHDAKVLPEVIEAINNSDIIVYGPGSLYTSIIPNLLLVEVQEALKKCSAERVFVCNVMTQPGETDNYGVLEHIDAIIRHAGEIMDYCIVNNGVFPESTLTRYYVDGSKPVKDNLAGSKYNDVYTIKGDLVDASDLARHNGKKLAEIIVSITDEKYRQ